MATDLAEIEKRLWGIADQFRANSGLKPSEYSRPVLGLLFLRYADGRFVEAEIREEYDELAEVYERRIWAQKVERTYQFVYERFGGQTVP